MRTYSELIELESHSERLEYLKLLDNNVNSPRHMSEAFYKSDTWKEVRRLVLERDMGFDLGVFGIYVEGPMLVHHINPITELDIVNGSPKLLDMENLITTSTDTHNSIHYKTKVKEPWVERRPGDTKLW